MPSASFLSVLTTCVWSVLVFVSAAHSGEAVQDINALLAEHWDAHKIQKHAPISDDVFLRRVYLDLAGRIPTAAETTAFLSSTEPRKRDALIDDLLTRESYVSHSFNYWADVLRFKSQYVNRANVIEAAYAKFIKESLRSNKPYDQFVRELLSAKGYAWDNGAIGYYHRDPEMPLDNMAITTRIFLGTRIECAQCHDHPFDKWKQTEFYHLAAFTHSNTELNEAFDAQRAAFKRREDAINEQFHQERKTATDGGVAAAARKQERLDALDLRGIAGIVKGPVGQLFSPIGLKRDANKELKLPKDFQHEDGKPGDVMSPRPLFAPQAEVSSGQDRAEAFAKWVTSPENPRFTRVIVNRLWKRMFGAPLTPAIDDLRDDSPSNLPRLEARLEKLMIELKYDMRAFLGVIARTQAYQSAVAVDELEAGQTYHFPGPLLRRMTAEQIWDSLVALTSYEPDAIDFARLAREERRIMVSKMAFDAYFQFDGEKLMQLAADRLAAERTLKARELEVREATVAAKRAGDTTKERELQREQGRLSRERGEARVRDFIMPMLDNLGDKIAPGTRPVVDPNYVMNPNPNILVSETWRSLHLTGYGPAPKTSEQLAAATEAERQRVRTLAGRLQIPEAEHAAFKAYLDRARNEWWRASELDSPAPRGHFLRTMGQSDRDFVENANPNASIPQALALLNGDLISEKAVLSRYSPLMQFVAHAKTSDEQARAVYIAILNREPTASDLTRWTAARQSGLALTDLIYALLNTKQFLFIQ